MRNSKYWIGTILLLAASVSQGALISHSNDFGTNYTVNITDEGSQDWKTFGYSNVNDTFTDANSKSGGSGIDGFTQSGGFGGDTDSPIGHTLSFTDGTSPASGATSGFQFNTGSSFPESPVTSSFTLSSIEVGKEHVFRLYFSAFRLSANFSADLNGATNPADILSSIGTTATGSGDGTEARRNGMYELRWMPDNLTDKVTVNLAWVDNPAAGFDRGGLAGATLSVIPEPATLGMVAAFGGGILFVRRLFMMG